MKPIDTLSDDELAHQVQRAVALPDAPAALIHAATALWPVPQPAGVAEVAEVAQAAWRLVHAVLRFDSAARPALAHGMRSSGTTTRHLLYSAQGRDIDLRLSPAAGRFALSGQILGPDEAGIVELVAANDATTPAPGAYRAALDELGAFRLDGVPSGTYCLTLRMGGDHIVLPPLEVGAAA
jgi:hypothetical protein